MTRVIFFAALAVTIATLARDAVAQFPEPAGKIEIVQATATKYAWIAENAEYVFDKVRPKAGSAFLVVEIKANVTYDDDGAFRSSVSIESAKGNRRAPVFGIADHRNLTTEEYVWDSAFDRKGATRRKLYRFVFIVPEQTSEATMVMHDSRAKMDFPQAPADYPPLGGGPMKAEVLSTKFVDERPKLNFDDRDLVVERSPGTPITILRKSDPAFSQYVAVELRFVQREAADAYVEESYHFQNKDFVAVYDDGVAYRGMCEYGLSRQIDEEGKLPDSMTVDFYFPIPPGATKGTVYLRQQPIAEFEVPK